MSKLEFSGAELTIDSEHIVNFRHDIQDAFVSNGIVIVLLNPDADLGKSSAYRNLLGLDLEGNQKWKAELPTDKKSDVYWRIERKTPLIVYSFSSFECEIDVSTGKIVSSKFYK